MSPEKFHPSEEGQPEKNSDGVQMNRRRFLPRFAALMAGMTMLGGCQKPQDTQLVNATPIKEPGPATEPKEVDADEAKEAEPVMRKIIVEQSEMSSALYIYPENFRQGEEIPKELHERWMQKVEDEKRHIKEKYSRLYGFEMSFGPCTTEEHAGQIYVSFTYTSIQHKYDGRVFSPTGESYPQQDG